MHHIITYDYAETNWLDPEVIQTVFTRNKISLLDQGHLRIPEWLRYLSLASPIVGCAAFVLIIAHVAIIVHRSHQDIEVIKQRYPFMPTETTDMILLVVAMPAVFIVMAVRSTTRMWMIMRSVDQGAEVGKDMALYTANLELACMCQYVVVLAFCWLCALIIGDETSDPAVKLVMKFAGFLGVYSFVVVGMLRSFCSLALALVGVNAKSWGLFLQEKSDVTGMIETRLGTAFSLVTLLCVFNMFIVCKVKFITRVLGEDVNKKFLGTRALILISQFQLRALEFIVDDENKKNYWILESMDLSVYRMRLLHSSLLTIECFFVILFNMVVWNRTVVLKADRADYEEILNSAGRELTP